MNRIIPGALCALLPAGTSISAVHAADFTFAGIGKQVKYGQGVGSGPTASGATVDAFYSSSTNFSIATTPEPAEYAPLLLGAAAVGLLPRRIFRRASIAK